MNFPRNAWALILGGSSGFGLATAKKLSRHGMNICIVHRDRRGSLERIEAEFQTIKEHAPEFLALNLDALSSEGQNTILEQLLEKFKQSKEPSPKIQLLLHSIAFGNLKPLIPVKENLELEKSLEILSNSLNVSRETLQTAVQHSLQAGALHLGNLATYDYGKNTLADEDLARTIYSMGTSLLTWVQLLYKHQLFTDNARVLGLTSEGNRIAWRGYAAVSAAKVALEAVSRAIAMEYGPYGLRSNIIQAGVTDTPALRAIPGSAGMKAAAKLRNPLGRLTTPEDVANFIYLLCQPEAAWVNGTILTVDGGESISS